MSFVGGGGAHSSCESYCIDPMWPPVVNARIRGDSLQPARIPHGRLEVFAHPTVVAFDDDRPPVAVYRLMAGKAEVPGWFPCLIRRFVELGEAAEGGRI